MVKSSAQHHYVPRFYLNRFASKAKRINIYNLGGEFFKEDISLREQCRRPNYYLDSNIEKALSLMEEEAAKAFRDITEQQTSKLPEPVLLFIGVKLLRTPSSVKTREVLQEKLLQNLTSVHPLPKEFELAIGRISHENLPVYNLMLVDGIVDAIRDLKFLVLKCIDNVFITSDNPVVKYNQYYERARGIGTTGVGQKGLQILLPLSPSHLLVLYDGNIYDYVKSHKLNERDIDSINTFQILSAETNVYFSDWKLKDRLKDLVLENRDFRSTDATVLEEFESDDDESDLLLHFYSETPNLALNFSFLQLKKRASRVSMGKRIGNSQRQARLVTGESRTGPAKIYSKLVAKI